jgi:uncharacterized protein GlcG (DUF336 family)
VISRPALSLDDALTMVSAALARAAELGIPVAVAVVDPGGVLIALHSMDGTQAAGPEVAIAKARAAVLFRRPTSAFDDVANRLGKPSVLLLPSAVAHAVPVAGGAPVLVTGPAGPPHAAGAVGVSGGSGEQDEDVAARALEALPLTLP